MGKHREAEMTARWEDASDQEVALTHICKSLKQLLGRLEKMREAATRKQNHLAAAVRCARRAVVYTRPRGGRGQA